MSYITTERLIHKKGRGVIVDALEFLNSGGSEKELAEKWGLSRARTCELCKKLFRKEYVLAQGARDALEFDLNRDRDEAEEIRKLIGPPSHLRLVAKHD